MTDTKLQGERPPQTVGARRFEVDEALEFADTPGKFLVREVSITELAVCRTLAWEVRRLQALSASGGAEAREPDDQRSSYEEGWEEGYKAGAANSTGELLMLQGQRDYFKKALLAHPAEPSVPQGWRLVPVPLDELEWLAAEVAEHGGLFFDTKREKVWDGKAVAGLLNRYRLLLSAAPPPDAPDLGSSPAAVPLTTEGEKVGAASVSGEPGPHHSASLPQEPK